MKVIPKQIQPGKVLIMAGCYQGDIEDTAWVIAMHVKLNEVTRQRQI